MKKSMIATAVVATAGLAASANAGYFSIGGSSVGGSNISVADLTSGDNTSIGLVADGNNTQKTMSSTVAANIVGNLGAALNDNTLTYFGFDSAGGAPAFFGFAFKATGTSMTFNVMSYQENNFANPFTSGVYAATYDGTNTTAVGTYDTSGKEWSTPGSVSVNAGTTLLVMFAGLPIGGQISGNAASSTTFGVEYLSWNASTPGWDSNYSGSGASSGLNVSTYAVPVPAPALLAGAGLVGAAALRRRMAKKA